MINGIFAGILFLVWVWFGWRINTHFSFTGKAKENFASLWAGTLLFYLFAAFVTVQKCGNLGDLLLLWAVISIAATLAIVLLLLAICVFILIPVAAIMTAWEVLVSPQKKDAVRKIFPRKSWLKVPAVFCVLAFIALCGWLGSQPNPSCEAPLAEEAGPDVEAIQAALAEHAPELVDDLEMMEPIDKSE